MATFVEPIISLDNVSKVYQEGKYALENITFEIQKGEFVFIVGPSGSGKSTLIKLLLKEITQTRGKIRVMGNTLDKMRRRKIANHRRGVGVVFQEFRLLNDRNVFENVAIAQRINGIGKKELTKNVNQVLALCGLSGKALANPTELSGGEKQRVALARALVNRPRILLADEPTGNLDPKNAWEVMALLDEVNKMGTTVIMVTHNPDIVDTMQKRVIVLQDGKLIKDAGKGGYLYERH